MLTLPDRNQFAVLYATFPIIDCNEIKQKRSDKSFFVSTMAQNVDLFGVLQLYNQHDYWSDVDRPLEAAKYCTPSLKL